MTRWLVPLALGLCSCTTTTDPDARYGAVKGESLVSVAGTITESRLDAEGLPTINTTSIRTRLGYGYFLTENHEIGANLGYNLEDTNVPSSDTWQLDLTALYNYNIRASSRTWYYVGVDLGTRWFDDEINDSDGSDLLYGLHVGLRNWLTPRLAFFAEPFWLRTEVDLNIDSGADLDQFGILFGLQYAF